MSDAPPVIIAQVGRPFGIAGWVYLQTFTDPVEKIFEYAPLLLQDQNELVWHQIEIEAWRSQQAGIVAKIKGCNDRTRAQFYTGLKIAASRESLPDLEARHFYWRDLEGLTVISESEGESEQVLGVVAYLYNQGASDVMVIVEDEKVFHIPFVLDETVKKIDLQTRRIIVDWDLAVNLA